MSKRTMQYEGFRSKPYKDSEGYWTQGYGKRVASGSLPAISEAQAAKNFNEDYSSLTSSFFKKYPQFKNVDANVAEVLSDLAYNMGPNWPKKFPKVLAYLNKKDYDNAGKQILNSKYAEQVGQRALDNVALLTGKEVNTNPYSASTEAPAQDIITMAAPEQPTSLFMSPIEASTPSGLDMMRSPEYLLNNALQMDNAQKAVQAQGLGMYPEALNSLIRQQ